MNNDNAVQFAPFASLRGYYDQIKKKEEPIEARRELSEDAQAVLSQVLSGFRKGQRVQVCYYNGRRYVGIQGILRCICFELGVVVIEEQEINVRDIIRAKALT